MTPTPEQIVPRRSLEDEQQAAGHCKQTRTRKGGPATGPTAENTIIPTAPLLTPSPWYRQGCHRAYHDRMYDPNRSIYRAKYVQIKPRIPSNAARSPGFWARGSAVGFPSYSITHATVMVRDDGARIPPATPSMFFLLSADRSESAAQVRGVSGAWAACPGSPIAAKLESQDKAAGESIVLPLTWDAAGPRERLANSRIGGDLRRVVADVVKNIVRKNKMTTDPFL